MSTPSFEIPKECKAGVVVDEGPNFRVEVKMVPVPEIGIAPLALPCTKAEMIDFLLPAPQGVQEFHLELCFWAMIY
jgi:hypothetical protein